MSDEAEKAWQDHAKAMWYNPREGAAKRTAFMAGWMARDAEVAARIREAKAEALEDLCKWLTTDLELRDGMDSYTMTPDYTFPEIVLEWLQDEIRDHAAAEYRSGTTTEGTDN
jgi:hypothetical protein